VHLRGSLCSRCHLELDLHPGVDVVLRRDAEHATEVVHMAVGVDDRTDRPVTAMGSVQRQRGRRSASVKSAASSNGSVFDSSR
jgi:hypothetical protein